MKIKQKYIPEQSKKVWDMLESIDDWNDEELNTARFELAVIDVFNYYKGKLSEEQLYYASAGLVYTIGGGGVRDPTIVYLELLTTKEFDKTQFIRKFWRNEGKHRATYDDFPEYLEDGFFKYCFDSLERAKLVTIERDRLLVKDMFEFNIRDLVEKGREHRI